MKPIEGANPLGRSEYHFSILGFLNRIYRRGFRGAGDRTLLDSSRAGAIEAPCP